MLSTVWLPCLCLKQFTIAHMHINVCRHRFIKVMKTVVINWITCFITLRKTKSRYVGCELWWWVVDWLYYVTIMQHEPAIMVVCKTQNAWFHENRAVVEWTKLFCLKTHSVGDITYNVDKWAPQTEYILMNKQLFGEMQHITVKLTNQPAARNKKRP